MTSGKRHFIFISAAALVLALIALLFVFAPSALAQEARFTGKPLPATRASGDVTISYTTRTLEESGSLDEGLPYYTIDSCGLTNACGAVAGGVVVTYFDIFKTELIPDYDPLLIFGGYKPQHGIPNQVITELYSLMHTNEAGAGVSESEFDEGLSDYVTSKGYSLTYSSAKSGGNIDYAAVKSAINSQRPVLVFTETANFYGQETRVAGGSTFHREFSVASHIFLINGYMKITYNKGLSSERELIIYESVSLKTAESCIIMGDAPVYNAKGVNIS